MATADQTRAKKILEDCLQEPANKVCADCNARQPRWASISLGCFFCLRCSGIHRNLGVHVSKVRSVSLDKWQLEWAKFMQENGNERVNSVYEHSLAPELKPSETTGDYQTEQFIRDKYVKRRWARKEGDSNGAAAKSKSANRTKAPVDDEREDEDAAGSGSASESEQRASARAKSPPLKPKKEKPSSDDEAPRRVQTGAKPATKKASKAGGAKPAEDDFEAQFAELNVREVASAPAGKKAEADDFDSFFSDGPSAGGQARAAGHGEAHKHGHSHGHGHGHGHHGHGHGHHAQGGHAAQPARPLAQAAAVAPAQPELPLGAVAGAGGGFPEMVGAVHRPDSTASIMALYNGPPQRAPQPQPMMAGPYPPQMGMAPMGMGYPQGFQPMYNGAGYGAAPAMGAYPAMPAGMAAQPPMAAMGMRPNPNPQHRAPHGFL
jgi:stromal membrane-associated protein